MKLILIAILLKIKLLIKFLQLKKFLIKNSSIKKKRNKVVLIANGPSIASLNLVEMLKDVDTIVMNLFYKHQSINKLNIVAYCYGENGSDMNMYHCVEHTKNILLINSDTYWFTSDFIKNLDINNPKIHFYFPGDDSVLKRSRKNIDLSKRAPYFESTAQMAIIVAIAMGYREIFLLGYDHNFLAVDRYLDHFYTESDGELKSDMLINNVDYQWLIRNCDKMWSRYKLIKKYADSRGIKIINCGRNSYLDVFKKIPYEKIFTSN